MCYCLCCLESGSHTSAIIGDCKTENSIEFVSRALLPSMGVGSSSVAPVESKGSRNRKSGRWCSCLERQSSFDHTGSERVPNTEYGSDRPTKEEAKSWTDNFDKMMSSQTGRKVFQEFLQSQYSDENMKFWLATVEYREKSESERKESAKTIYEDYISTISPYEVSLDANIRLQIEQDVDKAHGELFVPAQNYIYSLMYRDCFPRFLKSKHYKNLFK